MLLKMRGLYSAVCFTGSFQRPEGGAEAEVQAIPAITAGRHRFLLPGKCSGEDEAGGVARQNQ